MTQWMDSGFNSHALKGVVVKTSLTEVTVTNGGCWPLLHMEVLRESCSLLPEIDYRQRKHPKTMRRRPVIQIPTEAGWRLGATAVLARLHHEY